MSANPAVSMNVSDFGQTNSGWNFQFQWQAVNPLKGEISEVQKGRLSSKKPLSKLLTGYFVASILSGQSRSVMIDHA
jgi:hypothetical protein